MHTDLCINRKCNDLTLLLGSECLLFCPVLPQGESFLITKFGEQYHVANSAIMEAARNECPALQQAGADCYFAIPLEEKAPCSWFGIGRLPGVPLPIASKLISVAWEAMLRETANHELNDALIVAEKELKFSHSTTVLLRDLNNKHSKRSVHGSYNSRQAIDAARKFLHAEVVAAYIESDADIQKMSLHSIISSGSKLTVEDIGFLLKKVRRPSIGEALHLQNLRIRINKTSVRSLDIVPISESEIVGYLVAINAQVQPEFLHARTEVLHDICDFLLADGHTNAVMLESEQLALGILHSMSIAIEARDPYTHGHSERVAQVGSKIARRLGLPESSCKEIYLAGTLHDIGKIGIPDSVLLKPDRLSQDEFRVIQQHPEIGYKIIDGIGRLRFALPGILYHHERFDGKGYPHHLKGEEIPLMARILAVADAYDAMTRSRIYRTAMSRADACGILREGRNTQWDARAVDACLEWLDDTSPSEEDTIGNANLTSFISSLQSAPQIEYQAARN
jgi:HD-GYP domain-containing protein (c-di-GMP phosphodiesterase class II)